MRSTEGRKQKAECGARNTECGRQKAEGGMRSAECGARKAESGRQKAEGGMRSAAACRGRLAAVEDATSGARSKLSESGIAVE
jgi:hypothetical protein